MKSTWVRPILVSYVKHTIRMLIHRFADRQKSIYCLTFRRPHAPKGKTSALTKTRAPYERIPRSFWVFFLQLEGDKSKKDNRDSYRARGQLGYCKSLFNFVKLCVAALSLGGALYGLFIMLTVPFLVQLAFQMLSEVRQLG